MQVIFSDYFNLGLSIEKLRGEIAPYKIRIRGLNLEVAKFLFPDEHKDGCCHTLEGGDEYIPPEEQQRIRNLFTAHIPDVVPYILQCEVIGTAGNIISILNLQEVYMIEEFDNIKYFYFNTIPVPADFRQLLSTYVEPEPTNTVYLQKKQSRSIYFTTDGKDMNTVQPNEIIVSKNEGQFSSIVSAINYINTLTNKAVVIRIYPGTYIETESIMLPAGSNMIGEGSAGNTIIYGAHTDAVICTNDFNTIKNFNIIGAIGISHNGVNESAFVLVKDCLIKHITRAIYVYGGLGSLVLGHVSIYADPIQAGTWSGSTMYINGGSIIMSETIVQAQAEYGIELVNSKLTIDITSLYYCKNAISAKNNSQIKGTLVNIVDCYCGIYVYPNDIGFSQSKISINYLHIDNAYIDIQGSSSATLELYSGHIDTRKIQNKTNICGIFTNIQAGSLHQTITGETVVDGYIRFGLDIHDFTIYQNYLKMPSRLTYIETKNIITEIKYPFQNAGADPVADWKILDFYRAGDDYWLDYNYQPVETTINGQLGLWLQITGDMTEEFESANCVKIEGPELKFLGDSRKTEYLYLAPTYRSFIIPECIDLSTEYSIIIQADAGITINGEYFAGASAEKKMRFAPQNGIQSFTAEATNITMLVIKYMKICF